MNTTTPASSLISDTMQPALSVQLVSVNVGLPGIIGTLHTGEQVLSGIGKRPVSADRLLLTSLNLQGDRQADLTVHGGPDKAVYAYASEHLPAWTAELTPDPPFGVGTFGENLTTAGWLEDDVRIGDLWQWGDAVLQVAQPRSPCYKLAMVTRRPDMLKRVVRSGRSGWYLRVLQPGQVPVAGPIAVVERHPAGVTVLDAHLATLSRALRADVERVLAVDALAANWRGALEDRLAR
jgi:MOSC domain-containing protein YiiM